MIVEARKGIFEVRAIQQKEFENVFDVFFEWGQGEGASREGADDEKGK